MGPIGSRRPRADELKQFTLAAISSLGLVLSACSASPTTSAAPTAPPVATTIPLVIPTIVPTAPVVPTTAPVTVAPAAAPPTSAAAPTAAGASPTFVATTKLTGAPVPLVVYSAQGYDDIVTKGFQAATGIPTTLVDDSTGPLLAKVQAEKANPQWGLLWVDGDEAFASLDQQGMLLTGYEPSVSWTDPGKAVTYTKRQSAKLLASFRSSS